MPRRRELKSLAGGMATYCVCRNNDIGGYWGLGVLCRHAQEISVTELSIQILSEEPADGPRSAVRDNLRERFVAHCRHLPRFARSILVTFVFEAYSRSEIQGIKFRGTCTVSIKDDLGVSRSASASQLCYPHNPEFEHRSTRGEQGAAPNGGSVRSLGDSGGMEGPPSVS
jgi:hypothetical protein